MERTLGREAYAFREIIEHMALSWELFTPVVDMGPGMLGVGGCESLFLRLRIARTITGGYLARHFPGIQQALENGELDNVF